MLEQNVQKSPAAKKSNKVLDILFGQALASQGLLTQYVKKKIILT